MLERAREKNPGVTPILITDNGTQFIAKDFKSYLSLVGITHRRTRFYYPQSNGKVERFMQTIKNETIRRHSVIDFEDLRQQIENYVAYYNTQRLHSALGYIKPQDMLDGKQQQIFAERRIKLEAARVARHNAVPFASSAGFARVGDQHAKRGSKSRPSVASRRPALILTAVQHSFAPRAATNERVTRNQIHYFSHHLSRKAQNSISR